MQRALLPGKWNSWDFNGQLTRCLDLWHWALSPSRQHMLLSAELSYVAALPLHQPKKARESRNECWELQQRLSSSTPIFKNHWALFTSPCPSAWCLSLSVIMTPACGSSTCLLKWHNVSIYLNTPPPPNLRTHIHTDHRTHAHLSFNHRRKQGLRSYELNLLQ